MDNRVFLAVILIALLLRCTNLTTKELGVDEAITIQQAQNDFPSLIENLRFKDAHPPLYPIISWATYQIQHKILDIQMLSIAFGIGLLILTYATFKQFDEKIATYALILMTFNPLAIAYSQQMRMYGMFAFLFMGLIYLLLKFQKKPSDKLWLGIIVVNVALLLTHYHGFIVMACEFLYLWYSPSKEKVLLPIVSVCLILPVLLYFLIPSLSFVGGHTYTQRGIVDFEYVLYKFVAGINIGDAGFTLFFVGIALALIYGAMLFGVKDLKDPALSIFVAFFVFLLIFTFMFAQFFPVFFYFRYFFYILPLMFIPLGNFLKRYNDNVGVGFVCIIIICWLVVYAQYINIILLPEWNAVFGI